MYLRHGLRGVLAALVVWSLVAVPVAAQSTTTGSLRGTVTDPDGGRLPGATVIARSDVLVAGQQVSISGSAGAYRFPALPPGSYTVEAQLTGFQSVRQDNVRVGLGTSVVVDLQLANPEFAEEIVVVADAVAVNTVSNTVSHNLNAEFLARQPLPRDANALMNYTPGVNDGAAYGAPNSQATAYNLDGVDVSDPASGFQWILPNFDWVQEVQVTGLGADAEYGGFTGAVVNLVTKSGGNEFSGDLGLYYSDSSLNSENAPEGTEGVNELDSDWDLSVSLGGPVVQEKLWFFISGQERERTVMPFYGQGAPSAEQDDHSRAWSRYLGKLTYQITEANRLIALVDYDAVEHTRRGTGEFVLASGAQTQDSPNWSYNLSSENLINDNNFLTLKLTGFTGTDDRLPANGPNVPGRADYDTGFDWENYRYTWLTDKDRLTFDAAWSLYADGLLTPSDSHSFKFGVVYEDSTQDETRSRNGGFTYVDDSYYCDSLDAYFANPECGLYSSDRGSEIDFHAVQDGLHLYAQDTWSLSNFSVNVGVRYTSYQGGFANGDSDVYDQDMWAPRVGLVWDLLGDGGTALKLHYGRYYEGLFAFMYDREVSGDAWTPLEYWDWDFDLNDWVFYSSLPTGGAVMDPDISHPYVDQYVLSFEHQLTQELMFGVDLVHRENNDIIAMVNVNDDYDSLVAPGNPLGGGDLPFYELLSPQDFVLSNPEDGYRDYDSVMLRLNRRFTDGWSLNASLVWSDLAGNTDEVDGYEGAWEDWNGLINNDGKLSGHSEWELKVNGSVDLPWDIILSGYYLFRSGEYWTPYTEIRGLLENDRTTVNMLPLGSEQLDDRHLFDLHLEKRFKFGGDMSFGLMMDVFNVFNEDTTLAVNQRWGSYRYQWDAHPEESYWDASSTYGQPTAVEDGRSIRFGAKLSF